MAAEFLGRPPPGWRRRWTGATADGGEPQRRGAAATRRRRRGRRRVWDTRIVPLPAARRRRRRRSCCWWPATSPSSAPPSRRGCRRRSRSARCWCKEVHHRIKNNLQGVAGLLQQYAARHPEVAAVLGEAVGQVQAIAQVYGLQVGASGPLRLARVVEAIAQSVQRTFGRDDRVRRRSGCRRASMLPEAESIPIALTVNELLTNAVKHGRRRRALPARGRRRRCAADRCAMPAAWRRTSTWRATRAACPAWAWCARCCRAAARTLTLHSDGDEVRTTVRAAAAQRAAATASATMAAQQAQAAYEPEHRCQCSRRQGQDPRRRRRPAGAGHRQPRPGAGRLRGHRRRQRRRRHPAGPRAPAGAGPAGHPHGGQDAASTSPSTCATSPHVPFMFLSAFADDDDAAPRCEALGRAGLPGQAAGRRPDRADRRPRDGRLRGSTAGAAPAPPVQAAPSPRRSWRWTCVPLALGILMHRYSLTRAQAAATAAARWRRQGPVAGTRRPSAWSTRSRNWPAAMPSGAEAGRRAGPGFSRAA